MNLLAVDASKYLVILQNLLQTAKWGNTRAQLPVWRGSSGRHCVLGKFLSKYVDTL